MRKPGLFCCMDSLISTFASPNKKGSAFQVTGLKILGRIGTHFFLEKNIPFKMHKIIFFPENLKKILAFTSQFR